MNRFFNILCVMLISLPLSAQDIGKYSGTHKGKATWKMFENAAGFEKLTEEINKVEVIISKTGKIDVVIQYKLSQKGNDTWNYGGAFSGNISNDMSFSINGTLSAAVDIDWWDDGQREKNTGSGNAICEGKISDSEITGRIINLKKKGKENEITFTIPLKAGNDCDVSVTVPGDLKPGGDFYVIINKTGCVSNYTIYYNGKDKPVTNWDGKEVDVEVQVECCDQSAFMRKLIVPAYGSDTKQEEIKQDTGKPTDPKPLEIAGGITAGLLVVKLLQMFASGKGPKTPTPPPVEPKPPLKPGTPPKPDLNKKPDNKMPDVMKTNSGAKDKKILSPEDKRKKLEEMEEKMKQLREAARSENQTLNSFFGISRDLCKTIPAAFNETKDSVKRVYDSSHGAFDKVKEWGDELAINQKERSRFAENIGNISGTLKDTCVNYYKNLEFIDDAKDLKDYFSNKNEEFINDLRNDPKKTIMEYVETGLGIHHYEKALETDRPLEQRLAFLGLGIFNTGTSLSTGVSGSQLISNITSGKTASLNTMWQAAKLNFSLNSILFKQEIGKKFPEMYNEAKNTLIQEAVIIKVKNKYYEYTGEKEKTTLAYNVNSELEAINQLLK